MLIALIGLDGSGKTTQAKKLLSYFEKEGEKVCYIHWLRFYPSWIRFFSRQPHETSLKKSSSSSSSGVFYITMRTLLSIFNAVLISLRISFNLAQEKKVVLDRYLIDELVQLRYKGLSKRIFSFFLKITPITETMFYLQVSPRKALQREGGHNLSYFQKKADLYEKVAKLKKIKKIQVTTKKETFQRILENLL